MDLSVKKKQLRHIEIHTAPGTANPADILVNYVDIAHIDQRPAHNGYETPRWSIGRGACSDGSEIKRAVTLYNSFGFSSHEKCRCKVPERDTWAHAPERVGETTSVLQL